MSITLDQNLCGRILDVGGGGEGVIGRRWGRQVTAIDNRQDELDETPDCCEKLLMDAAALDFPNAAFDHVTCFFSLLFMDRDTQAQAIREALPQEECSYFGAPHAEALGADTIYVGFWTDKGICDEQTAHFLQSLTNQKVFLFGTAGFGGAPAYFE